MVDYSYRQRDSSKKYEYTFDDWEKGEKENINLFYIYHNDLISESDYKKISREQSIAYEKYLNDGLNILKRVFKYDYDRIFIKDDFLNKKISSLEADLEEYRKHFPEVVNNCSVIQMDGRHVLSKKEVDKYIASNWDMLELYAKFSNTILTPILELVPAFYIVNVNFYKWLIWFKEQESQKEPTITYSDNSDEEQFIENLFGRSKSIQVSYTWLSNPDSELPSLYQLLIVNKLIHPDTTEEQLKAVFTAKPLHYLEPIKWHDDNASELLYFILQLESTESIQASKQTNYQRLKACFVKPDGKPFEEVFKSLKTRIEYNLSEQKQHTIKSILNSFL